MRVRFAPSPTGHLHVGNARTALFNWLLARGQGGTFILRIEDTDVERSTKASEAKILEDLRWMGLDWDEGVEAGGTRGPYRQSERFDVYRAHTQRLLDSAHAYRCFCSAEKLEAERQAQLAAGQPPRYAGTCRALDPVDSAHRHASGEPAVIRLRVPENRDVAFDDLVRGRVVFHTNQIGDPVLVRSDGIPAYNYAVVVDDQLMAISHVVRGEDHISNTPRQVLVYEAFGWTPPAFAHLSLVLGPDHAPLSKRHGATSVAEFRAKGYLPEALVNYLALIGWGTGGDELMPAIDLARQFRLEDVSHSAGVFDEDKLSWVNRHYLKSISPNRLAAEALPFLTESGIVTGPVNADGQAWLETLLPGIAASVDRLNQLSDRLHGVFTFDAAAVLADDDLRRELAEPVARSVVAALAQILAGAGPLVDRDTFRAAAAQVRERTGAKGKALFHPMRVALTGAAEGPELDLLIPAIDRAATLPSGSGLRTVVGCRQRAAEIVEHLR